MNSNYGTLAKNLLTLKLPNKTRSKGELDIDLGRMLQAAMLEDMVKQTGYKSSLLAVIFLGCSWCKWVDIDVIATHFLQDEEGGAYNHVASFPFLQLYLLGKQLIMTTMTSTMPNA
jgi:hypothetical protein